MSSVVLSWGLASAGALSLRDAETSTDNEINTAHPVEALEGCEIQNISSGENHILVCLTDGSVLSCGTNSFLQGDEEKNLTKFEWIEMDLPGHGVTQVAAGSSHSAALTTTHEVLVWGQNDKGQLGRDVSPESTEVPGLFVNPVRSHEVELFDFVNQHTADKQKNWTGQVMIQCTMRSVLQISCGNDHTLVLRSEGLVGVWGSNAYGQLGLGRKFGPSVNVPKFVSSLHGIPVRQVAAGGYHSFVLTMSGNLYGWGRNSYGQLGVNDTIDYAEPVSCDHLSEKNIKFICCGENHTACLNKDGRVFTFGDGSCGQLGHNSYSNELLPRQIQQSLSDKEVSQVACGRRHTLAYVPKSDQLYAFGNVDSGQLGLSSTEDKNCPLLVTDPCFSASGHTSSHSSGQINSQRAQLRIKSIYAGGDHSFVIAEDAELCEPADFRLEDSSKQIQPLTVGMLHQRKTADNSQHNSTEEMKEMFQSPSRWNSSFLLPKDKHYGCSSQKHGVDMHAVQMFFGQLKEISGTVIIENIKTNIESLLELLPANPTGVEALRIYLILPECHLFQDPQLCNSIICVFAKKLLSLDKRALDALDSWWSSNLPSFFETLVEIYKKYLQYLLGQTSSRNPPEVADKQVEYFATCLKMLGILNKVNEAHQIVSYDKFHVPELKDKVSLCDEYIKWLQRSSGSSQIGGIKGLYFCDFLFLFDVEAKSSLLQIDAALQMEKAIEYEWQQKLTSGGNDFDMTPKTFHPGSPCLYLTVSRDNIVQDTLRQLQHKEAGDFKKPLKVRFIGELAADGGGVRKEFFRLLLQEVLEPEYGMFVTVEDSKLLWFNSSAEPEKFKMIGILCGLAIYNFTITDLHFPSALYKKLLKKCVTLKDLSQLSPAMGSSLQNVKDFEEDEINKMEMFDLTFDCLVRDCSGCVKNIELCPDGSNKDVTSGNKHEYIDLYVDYYLNKSIDTQFQAFSQGFQAVCELSVLNKFQPEELQEMMMANQEYDFQVFEKNTQYYGEFNRNHQTIKFFWKVFHKMSLEDQKQFLIFLTGSHYLPVSGIKSFKMTIQPMGGGDEYLPVAHTCFGGLDLPKYTKMEILKSQLLRAIQTKNFW